MIESPLTREQQLRAIQLFTLGRPLSKIETAFVLAQFAIQASRFANYIGPVPQHLENLTKAVEALVRLSVDLAREEYPDLGK